MASGSANKFLWTCMTSGSLDLIHWFQRYLQASGAVVTGIEKGHLMSVLGSLNS